MASRSWFLHAAVVGLLATAAGCIQKPDLTDPQVYVGRKVDGVDYQPFANSSPANVISDATVCFPDTSIYCPDVGGTLKVVVPDPGDPENAFAGGSLVAAAPRNLSGYDAVSFWAKSTRAAPLIVGIGVDLSENRYIATGTVGLTTEWTQHVLPVPLPTRLNGERGLFHFSAGADGSPATGFTFWLADIQYVSLGTAIGGPNPVLRPTCTDKRVGDAAFPAFGADSIPVGFTGSDVVGRVGAATAYFSFGTSDATVATVDPAGRVSVMGEGTATITAQLGGVQAAGALTVNVGSTPTCSVPTTIAPTPTLPASSVISLFGTAYTPRAVSSWHTSWSECCSREFPNTTIGSHPVKKYVLFPFNGVAISPDGSNVGAIDASAMTFLHIDVWTPDGYAFIVKLVNDPGGTPSESSVTSEIAQNGAWVSLEIPLSAFQGLAGTTRIGQMLFLVPDGTSSTWYVDNVYFHD